MKKEYDFSKGIRGKFYNPDAILNIPIYLEPEVKEFIEALASKKQVNMQELVNSIIKNNIQLYHNLI
ncbi:MAG: hypothetical protein HW421_1685 [Ignavibacteria bacterium]|nr:hypothetical protein [Ignavibacteria bacterium]